MMERLVRTAPAYDYRGQTPNYGQHGLTLLFMTKDSTGALVFSIHTSWYIEALKRVQIGKSGSFTNVQTAPYCTLDFHAPATLRNSVDQDPHAHCDFIDGPCQSHQPVGYTGRLIGELFFTLLEQPMDEFWALMEQTHKECTLV